MALGERVGPERYLEVPLRAPRRGAGGDDPRGVCVRRAGVRAGDARLRGHVDLADKPHQQRLAQPPTAGVRDWRTEMSPADVTAFEDDRGRSPATPWLRGAPPRWHAPVGACACAPALVPRATGGVQRACHGAAALAALATAPSLVAGEANREGDAESSARRGVSAAEGGQDAVGGEEVRPLRRDHGRVLAHRQLPHDATVGDPRRIRALCQRAEEHEVADHDRRAEDPAADRGLPQLPAGRPPGRRAGGRRSRRRRSCRGRPRASCSRARRRARSRRCRRHGRRARPPCPSVRRCTAGGRRWTGWRRSSRCGTSRVTRTCSTASRPVRLAQAEDRAGVRRDADARAPTRTGSH